jgi:tetratricopeptide (TPR) repeat protein
MNRAACWIGPVWMTISVLMLAGRAPGQSMDAAGILYSHGVYAYFDGNVGEAEQYFARAIASNPNDPCAYYFRGLSRLRLGRDADARTDLEAGAATEARQPNRYAVGTALQRVQGGGRLLLEQYRRRAREAYALQREQVSRARYEQIISREAEVLRRKVTVPLDQLVSPGEAQSLVGSEGIAEPGHAPAAAAAAPAAASDAPPAAKVGGDPFADEPASSEPAASQPDESPASDLFGTPSPKPGDPSAAGPADSTAAPEDAAEAEADPFRLDEENPFDP